MVLLSNKQKNRAKAISRISSTWIKEIQGTLSMDMIDIVIEEAYEYWERAKCTHDFCIQNVSLGCIVFGGTNRLIWSYKYGFKIDKSYCSSNFLKSNKGYK